MVHRLYWRGDLRAHGSLQNGMYAGCSLHACMCPLYIHVSVCVYGVDRTYATLHCMMMLVKELPLMHSNASNDTSIPAVRTVRHAYGCI